MKPFRTSPRLLRPLTICIPYRCRKAIKNPTATILVNCRMLEASTPSLVFRVFCRSDNVIKDSRRKVFFAVTTLGPSKTQHHNAHHPFPDTEERQRHKSGDHRARLFPGCEPGNQYLSPCCKRLVLMTRAKERDSYKPTRASQSRNRERQPCGRSSFQ